MLYHSMKEDQNQKPVHVCAHKQQYIAVEAKKHFLWEDVIHPFKFLSTLIY